MATLFSRSETNKYLSIQIKLKQLKISLPLMLLEKFPTISMFKTRNLTEKKRLQLYFLT